MGPERSNLDAHDLDVAEKLGALKALATSLTKDVGEVTDCAADHESRLVALEEAHKRCPHLKTGNGVPHEGPKRWHQRTEARAAGLSGIVVAFLELLHHFATKFWPTGAP